MLFSIAFYETEAHLEALGCFSLFSEAHPGFRRGKLCPEAVFAPSIALALSQEVPTVGLALNFFPHCIAAAALLVSELKWHLRNSFLAMKHMGMKLIFLVLKYSSSTSSFVVMRMSGNIHGAGEGLYRGVHEEVRQAFCRVHYVLLSLRGCGNETRPPSLLSINLLSTKPSGCPQRFHFHMLDK